MEELRSGEDSDAERRSQSGAADDSEKADGESEENGEFLACARVKTENLKPGDNIDAIGRVTKRPRLAEFTDDDLVDLCSSSEDEALAARMDAGGRERTCDVSAGASVRPNRYSISKGESRVGTPSPLLLQQSRPSSRDGPRKPSHAANPFTCLCGKYIISRSSIWYHKKKCEVWNSVASPAARVQVEESSTDDESESSVSALSPLSASARAIAAAKAPESLEDTAVNLAPVPSVVAGTAADITSASAQELPSFTQQAVETVHGVSTEGPVAFKTESVVMSGGMSRSAAQIDASPMLTERCVLVKGSTSATDVKSEAGSHFTGSCSGARLSANSGKGLVDAAEQVGATDPKHSSPDLSDQLRQQGMCMLSTLGAQVALLQDYIRECTVPGVAEKYQAGVNSLESLKQLLLRLLSGQRTSISLVSKQLYVLKDAVSFLRDSAEMFGDAGLCENFVDACNFMLDWMLLFESNLGAPRGSEGSCSGTRLSANSGKGLVDAAEQVGATDPKHSSPDLSDQLRQQGMCMLSTLGAQVALLQDYIRECTVPGVAEKYQAGVNSLESLKQLLLRLLSGQRTSISLVSKQLYVLKDAVSFLRDSAEIFGDAGLCENFVDACNFMLDWMLLFESNLGAPRGSEGSCSGASSSMLVKNQEPTAR